MKRYRLALVAGMVTAALLVAGCAAHGGFRIGSRSAPALAQVDQGRSQSE